MKLIKLSILFFIVVALTHCTVQKRSHRNGYYVSWNKKAGQSLRTDKKAGTLKTEVVHTTVKQDAKTPERSERLFASVEKANEMILTPLKIKPLRIEKDTCGDLITMRDGTEILAKVIEVSTNEIKYKRCDNFDGPLIISNVDNVFMIKYVSGAKEVFKKKEVTQPANDLPPEVLAQNLKVERVNNKYGIGSFVTFCLFFLYITVPISITLGIIALVQHKKHPDKYKNMWFAIVPIIVISVGLLLFAVFVLALIF